MIMDYSDEIQYYSVENQVVSNNNITTTELTKNTEHCIKLKFIGVYLIFILIAGIFCNSTLLWIFCVKKELRIPLNIFIIALAFNNILGCLTELPLVIISSFYCKWVYHKNLCVLTAFIMYFVGCSSIYLITAISFERLTIVHKPMKAKFISLKQVYLIVFVCFMLGFFWAVMPFFGWSYYSFEGVGTSCSIEWNERSMNVMSYNITILILVFLVPLTCIIATNFFFLILLKKSNKSASTMLKYSSIIRRLQSEKELTYATIIFIAMFMVSWLPYGLVCVYRVIWKTNHLSPFISTLPAMFAKSSLVWTPLFYILLNKKIKEAFFSKVGFEIKIPGVTIEHKRYKTTPKNSFAFEASSK